MDVSTKPSEEIRSKNNRNQPVAAVSVVTSSKRLQTEIHPETLSSATHAIDAIFSPIRRVPLDMLHEIVLYCLPIHPTIESASPIISSLSLVSSTWRAAVLSSPRLWSRLFVTVQSYTDLDYCAQVVTRWFQHARSAPLSFFLNIDFEAEDEDVTPMHSFLAKLSPLMPRVHHFGLHARLTTELLCSLVGLEWKFPQLKKLDLLSHSDLDQVDPIAFSVPLFHTAPNLVQVAIQNAITSARDILHVLPWSQLTDINMVYSIPVSRWIELMNMCPKMRVCEVAFEENDEVSPSSLDSYSPKGVHHTLERLYLDILDGCPPFLNLLSLYDLPSLQTLHVLYHSEPLLQFPRPQGIATLSNLREFSFSAMAMQIPREHFTYLAQVLREMVNLEELELQQSTQDFVPLYEALSFKRSEEAILPRLSTLKLWVSSVCIPEKDEELRPLLEMLSSRSKEGDIPAGFQPLQDFIVGVETDDVYERIRKVFDPWVGRLPSQLRVSIDLSRDYRFEQPAGWTFPISE